MRRAGLPIALAAVATSTLVPPAHGARPMITDDARIVDSAACQLETWTRLNRGSTEYWALPACNPVGNLEITFGGARTRSDDATRFTDELIQAKTLFRPLDERGLGFGVAFGTVRHPQRAKEHDWPGDPYAYVPISVAFADGAWVSHLNLGAARRRDEGRNVATWGLGHEVRLRPDLYFIPEVFHTDPGRPSYQVGLRYWVLRDVLQVDATVGNRLELQTDARWFSIGLRILTPAFLR